MTDADGGATRRSLLAGGLALGGLAGFGGCLGAPPTYTPVTGSPRLIAHRGCAADHPENTVPAVSAAASVADAVEVDVRRCRSGELIAFHDERLAPLTDETGRVDRRSCSAVLSAEVEDSGATVPTLREILAAVPPEVDLVVELKTPSLVQSVLEQLEGYGHDVLVSADQPGIIEEVGSADPAVETAYIVRESRLNRALRPVVPGVPRWLYLPEDTIRMVRTASDLGCSTIHPRYELCLRTDLVARAHRAGLQVEAWTATELAELQWLTTAGVDGIFSDVCRGAKEYLDWVSRDGSGCPASDPGCSRPVVPR